MKILGICLPNQDINFETTSLSKEAKKLYDEVILIDPLKTTYKLIRGSKKPEIFHKGQNIENITTLIVRGTRGRESSITLLARSLSLCGCDVLSPLWRFTPKQALKILGSIERFRNRVGSSTYFAFDTENAIILLQDLQKRNFFPLLVKPVGGKQGQGIKLILNFKEAVEYSNNFFKKRKSSDIPIFLQNYIKFQKEYRILGVRSFSNIKIEFMRNSMILSTFLLTQNDFHQIPTGKSLNLELEKFGLPHIQAFSQAHCHIWGLRNSVFASKNERKFCVLLS